MNDIYCQKENKAKRLNTTVQPYITFLCIGIENPLKVTGSYVIINKYQFKVETPMKAVDLAFKSFFSLNLNYPKESEHLWEFIQKYFYNITTDHDKQFTSTNIILNDLKQFC